MHTIQTYHLHFEQIGGETLSRLNKDGRTVLLKSFRLGVAALAIVAFAGCQQFAGKTGKTSVAQPESVAQETFDAHDSSWISQAHALASKTGSEAAMPDLSY